MICPMNAPLTHDFGAPHRGVEPDAVADASDALDSQKYNQE